MKIVKKLKHNQKELSDAFLGWDIFWCGDYSSIDKTISGPVDIDTLVIPKGYTIIFAVNVGRIKFLKRFFIKVKNQ